MKETYKWKQLNGQEWDVIIDYEKLSIEIPLQKYYQTLSSREALDLLVNNFVKIVAKFDSRKGLAEYDPMFI